LAQRFGAHWTFHVIVFDSFGRYLFQSTLKYLQKCQKSMNLKLDFSEKLHLLFSCQSTVWPRTTWLSNRATKSLHMFWRNFQSWTL
jgi:hypothetical protein